MMDRVLAKTPPGVLGFYAQEYDLAEKIQGEVDDSIVSITLAFTFVPLKSIAILTNFYQNQLIRQKLDSGLGDELFKKYRAAEKHGPDDFDDMSKYLTVVFAAMMMEFGATLKKDHIKYLRDLVPKIHCDEGPANPLCDHGFRGPGKRQFLAALDHYEAGKPRSFQQPSCHNCGKINDDIKAEGKTLLKCGGCGNERAAAWFCGKVRWAAHFHFTPLHTSLTFGAGLPERLVEAPQAQLRCSSRARNRSLQIIRQEQHGHHRLRWRQCVRVFRDDGTAVLVLGGVRL